MFSSSFSLPQVLKADVQTELQPHHQNLDMQMCIMCTALCNLKKEERRKHKQAIPLISLPRAGASRCVFNTFESLIVNKDMLSFFVCNTYTHTHIHTGVVGPEVGPEVGQVQGRVGQGRQRVGREQVESRQRVGRYTYYFI